MTSGMPVDLPKVQAKQLNDQKPPIVVSVDAARRVLRRQERGDGSEGLLAVLSENSENNKDRRIHVRGDKAVAYGKVVEAMGIINAAGYGKVALVSEGGASGSRRRRGPVRAREAPRARGEEADGSPFLAAASPGASGPGPGALFVPSRPLSPEEPRND